MTNHKRRKVTNEEALRYMDGRLRDIWLAAFRSASSLGEEFEALPCRRRESIASELDEFMAECNRVEVTK